MWTIKLVFIALFLIILVSLFQALWMMRQPTPNKSMSVFLGRRLLISVILLILILLACAVGIITPNPRPY